MNSYLIRQILYNIKEDIWYYNLVTNFTGKLINIINFKKVAEMTV